MYQLLVVTVWTAVTAIVLGPVDTRAATAEFTSACPYLCFNQSLFKNLVCTNFQLETFELGALTASGVTISSGQVPAPVG